MWKCCECVMWGNGLAARVEEFPCCAPRSCLELLIGSTPILHPLFRFRSRLISEAIQSRTRRDHGDHGASRCSSFQRRAGSVPANPARCPAQRYGPGQAEEQRSRVSRSFSSRACSRRLSPQFQVKARCPPASTRAQRIEHQAQLVVQVVLAEGRVAAIAGCRLSVRRGSTITNTSMSTKAKML